MAKFCTTREKFKNNPTLYRDQLKDLAARLEVKLKIKRDNIKKEIKELETMCMSDESVKLKFEPGQEERYNEMKQILVVIESLLKNLI